MARRSVCFASGHDKRTFYCLYI